jgi:hypothetical protein
MKILAMTTMTPLDYNCATSSRNVTTVTNTATTLITTVAPAEPPLIAVRPFGGDPADVLHESFDDSHNSFEDAFDNNEDDDEANSTVYRSVVQMASLDITRHTMTQRPTTEPIVRPPQCSVIPPTMPRAPTELQSHLQHGVQHVSIPQPPTDEAVARPPSMSLAMHPTTPLAPTEPVRITQPPTEADLLAKSHAATDQTPTAPQVNLEHTIQHVRIIPLHILWVFLFVLYCVAPQNLPPMLSSCSWNILY